MRRPIAITGGVLTALALLTGCTSVVDGSGTSVATESGPGRPGSSSAAAPGASPSTGSSSSQAVVPASATCPTISYPSAHIVYPCITSGMAAQSNDPIWQSYQVKSVDSKGNWGLGEGASGPLDSNGEPLQNFAYDYRTQMVNQNYYLPSPKVTTVSGRPITVDGVKAYVLQTLMTLNPAQAKKNDVPVTQERLWLVAFQIDADHVTMWHVTLPNLVKQFWPKVPALINAIKID